MTAKTIINKNWYIVQATNSFFLVLGILCAVLWDGTAKWYSIIPLLIGTVFIGGYALIIPNRVRYDGYGLTVYYMFGLKTHAEWKELRSVHTSLRGQIFPWQECYEIGYFRSKIIFHHEACIPKNKKTTRMLEEYYKRSQWNRFPMNMRGI